MEREEYNSRDRCIRRLVLVHGKVLLFTVTAQLTDRDHWLVFLLHLGSIHTHYNQTINVNHNRENSYLNTPMMQIKQCTQLVILHEINKGMEKIFGEK